MNMTKIKPILITTLVALLVILCAVAIVPTFAKASTTTGKSYTLSSNKYEFTDNTGYIFGTANSKTAYSNGLTQLGSLSVSGDDLTISTYNGVTAIGVNQGVSLTFTYKQSVSSVSYGGHDWKLSSDSATSIAGYSVGTIGNGAIIVLSSEDGVNWKETGAKMVGINNKTFMFSPAGSELQQSRYYKFLSVAEIYYSYASGTHKEYPSGWCKFWGCHASIVTDYSNYYTNLGQMTTVYVCPNNPEITFTSNATQNHQFNSDADLTDEEISFLKKGATLTDGGVSFSSITVNNAGNTCFNIYCSFNGAAEKSVSSGTTFIQEGKYVFRVQTPLGTEKTTTLYIVNASDDLAFSEYFADGLIDGSQRMLNTTKAVPVYMVGKDFTIAPQSKWLPGLYGELWYFKDETALEKEKGELVNEFKGLTEKFTGKFYKQGYWIFNLFSSDPNASGTEIVNYSFRIYAWDKPDYVPTVNYDLLTSTSRNDLFSRRVYAVSLPTAGGGAFVYCFPHTSQHYDLALSIAEQIELLSVEEYSDASGTYYYYKSPTANTKQRYLSKTKLFEAISYFAEQNVGTLYLESDTEYLTYAADEETLKSLSKQSIPRDVCVTLNDFIKKELQAEEIYLNGFMFVSVADYESSVVMACDEHGNQYYIPYGISMDEIFSETTRLQITEVNWNGKRVYNAIYYKQEDNFGEIVLNISGSNQTFDRYSANIVRGSNVSIVSAGDIFDSQSMLSITDDNGDRWVMLLSEASGCWFEEGHYTLKITNRFGVSFTIELEASLTSEADIPLESALSGYAKAEQTKSSSQQKGEATNSIFDADYTKSKNCLAGWQWALIGISIAFAVVSLGIGAVLIVRKVRH